MIGDAGACHIFRVTCVSAQSTFRGRGKINITIMKTQTDKSFFLLSTIAGIAVILLGVAGVARITGWLPNPIGGFGTILAIEVFSAASAKSDAEPGDVDLPQAPGNARKQRRCPECSVIVSMREIDASGQTTSPGPAGQKVSSNENGLRGTSARSYEFTLGLEGGSGRVIIDANPASWWPGPRVIFIDGANPARQ
jgi:hypothetical protein